LKLNLKLNRVKESRCVTRFYALASRESRVTPFLHNSSGEHSILLPSSKAILVKATTLDRELNIYFASLVKFPNSVILKIDVEGAEAEVLRGGLQFINAFKPYIAIEVDAANLKRISLILKDNGYVVYAVPYGMSQFHVYAFPIT